MFMPVIPTHIHPTTDIPAFHFPFSLVFWAPPTLTLLQHPSTVSTNSPSLTRPPTSETSSIISVPPIHTELFLLFLIQQTTDPVRYGVLAVLTQLMCDAFNRRIERGLPRDAPAIILDFAELEARPKVFEETPDWAKQVIPLDERFFIPNQDAKVLKEDYEDVSEEFKAMNIIVQIPHIHFI